MTARRTAIGLEVHVQLRTASKMFCGCPARFGPPPNTRVCPVCLGLPGALPVPNRAAVKLALRAAAALGCRVRRRSLFDRKHYTYPDLPKGYQITQYRRPLAESGRVAFRMEGEERRVGIRRLHLEEDAGRSLHDRFPGRTAVDLNRAGIPLVEIVTEPELGSPAEARACLARLKQLLEHYAAVSDCDMEEGSLRVDANLSLPSPGVEGVRGGCARTEVKNLNSFRNVERALAHERDRQARRLERGEPVERETRLFDPARGITRPMRGKEESFDYRYMPDPDLPPLCPPEEWIREAEAAAREGPHRREARLHRGFGLPLADAERLAARPGLAGRFEAAADRADPALSREVARVLLGPLAAEANRLGTSPEALLPPAPLRRVAELREEGVLSSNTADRAVRLLVDRGASDGEDVDALVESRGLRQVRDPDRLAGWVEEALRSHPEEARRFARGEAKLLGFFMGRVMEIAAGRADPRAVREMLRSRLPGKEGGWREKEGG